MICTPVSLPGERWLAITGYEGRYEVSNLGRVKSLDRPHSPGVKLLKQHIRRHQYLSVVLYNDSGTPRRFTVHRLVLLAFIGANPGGMECCHADGDPQNNRAENLYWGTHAENVRDIKRHGRNYQANKVECVNGHPFDESNTRIAKSGQRVCKKCHCAAQRAYTRRKVS